MPEIIKKNWDIALVVGIGIVLTIAGFFGMLGMISLPSPASAATTATVGVTATVQAWLAIEVSPTSVTLSPDLVDAAGDAHIGSSTQNVGISVGTNNSSGWSVTIEGLNNGLASSTNLIASVTGSSTLAAGTDGYGANATNSITGVTIADYYKYWGTTDVGQIATSTNLASKTNPQSLQQVALMKVYAAATSTKPSGSYQDTITLTVTP